MGLNSLSILLLFSCDNIGSSLIVSLKPIDLILSSVFSLSFPKSIIGSLIFKSVISLFENKLMSSFFGDDAFS